MNRRVLHASKVAAPCIAALSAHHFFVDMWPKPAGLVFVTAINGSGAGVGSGSADSTGGAGVLSVKPGRNEWLAPAATVIGWAEGDVAGAESSAETAVLAAFRAESGVIAWVKQK